MLASRGVNDGRLRDKPLERRVVATDLMNAVLKKAGQIGVGFFRLAASIAIDRNFAAGPVPAAKMEPVAVK